MWSLIGYITRPYVVRYGATLGTDPLFRYKVRGKMAGVNWLRSQMYTRHIASLVAAVTLSLSPLYGQSTTGAGNAAQLTASGAIPGFAAASIRPSSSTLNGFKLRTSSDRLTITGITAKEFIEYAYDLEPFQVKGGPNWANQDRFDIVAVLDDASAASANAEKKVTLNQVMARQLLATRFGLVVHTESTPGATYELSLAKPMTAANHPGLQSHVADAHSTVSGNGLPGAYNVTMTDVGMSALARRLEDYLHAPVVDKTAMTGTFDITFHWYSDEDLPDGAEDLPGSLKSQLNLKLTRIQAPTDILVIDGLNHPSEN